MLAHPEHNERIRKLCNGMYENSSSLGSHMRVAHKWGKTSSEKAPGKAVGSSLEDKRVDSLGESDPEHQHPWQTMLRLSHMVPAKYDGRVNA